MSSPRPTDGPDQGTLALATPEDERPVAAWEAAAAAVLRKARRLGEDDADGLVWQKLTRRTLDGVGVTPLGTAASVAELPERERPRVARGWDVRGLVEPMPADLARETALADLDGGTTSVWLQLDEETATGEDLTDELAERLDGVLLDLAGVVLDAPAAPLAAADAFLSVLGSSLEEGVLPARGTNLGCPADADADALVAVARLAQSAGVAGVVVDGTAVHDRGASDGTELAHVLASGVRVLRVLEAGGLPPLVASTLIELRVAVTDEQLASVAKVRALRRLWDRVLEVSTGHAGVGSRIHAVTSRPMMTRYDSYTNMLRTTVAAFSAGVGGADAVTVLPFDAPLGRSESFGRRIARNTSHLLVEESHVARVADPAGGSYAIERLTHDLAEAAWALFIDLDTPDGPDLGLLEERIAATVAERDAQVATRRRPVTGVSEFPNLAEDLPVREPSAAFEDVVGWARAYEAMRDEPPARHAFLATLGPVAQHTARATFATNLLAAGGIAVDVAGATTGPDDLVAAWDGQPVVVLAGSDPTYEEWGAAAAEALRAAGATRVVVAGKPADHADDSCAMGVDALAFLTRTRAALGAALESTEGESL
ncbi:methylmalonyl-CoA mutase family protein [Nocardioides bruguierae]|uniref:methylmalonyl-CoA mutase family protein n=1 Tax=Nocardioides bruguierae TaxID=2945102 RepID=UPI002020EB49|nr:methylmalonyl-CoA mutase family protein [Nocardioides bruguierae]MCL8025204.1 methylmalonyl-CoA mutase family protein [Nocardioides bruguierae]